MRSQIHAKGKLNHKRRQVEYMLQFRKTRYENIDFSAGKDFNDEYGDKSKHLLCYYEIAQDSTDLLAQVNKILRRFSHTWGSGSMRSTGRTRG